MSAPEIALKKSFSLEENPTILISILLFSSVWFFFSFPGIDNDLWGHLFFGKEILQGGQLPLKNTYSYTAPDYPWINHEWLAEIIFYRLYSLTGSSGLIFLKVAFGGGIIWMLNRTVATKVSDPWARFVALIWVMALLAPGFNVRPQMFTYLMFTAFLFLLNRVNAGSLAGLYCLPVLTLLWVNMHGGFVAGLGALGLCFLFTLASLAFPGKWTGPTIGKLWIPFALSLLSVLVNPYGLGLLEFLWDDLRLDRQITEWEPILLWSSSFLEFKLAVLVLLLSVRKDSWLTWESALAILAALLAFRHQRHTPLFAIAAAPLLAQGLERIFQWVRQKNENKWTRVQVTAVRGILAAGLILGALAQTLWVLKVHWKHGFQLVVSPEEYPTQAADFLLRNGVRGNIAHPFDWGEYFIWKLYPTARVSIDGRYTTAYPLELITESWVWMNGEEGWRRLLEKYPTDIAITDRRHPVTALMRNDPEWIYVYSDPVAFIFVKETPDTNPFLEKFKAGKLVPPKPPSHRFPG